MDNLNLYKEAGWKDVIETLGFEALLTGAQAAAGAAGVMSGGATGLAGAGAAIGLTAGWPLVLTILGAAGTAYAIYVAATKANNSVEELIERFESLDAADEHVAAKIDSWANELRKYQQLIGPGEIAANVEERARQSATKINALQNMIKYLETVVYEWQQVKQRLTDWGWDDTQAEETLNNTLAATKGALEEAKVAAQSAAQEHIQKVKETGGRDYSTMASNVVNIYNQLSQAFGKPPEFDNEAEQAGFALAKKIVDNKATMTDIDTDNENLVMLHYLLQQAIKKINVNKVSYFRLSKRALTLGDGTKVTLQDTVGPTQAPTAKPLSKRNPDVIALQKSINYLNQTYGTGAETINEDGIYGPQTAIALNKFLSLSPDVAKWTVRQTGVENLNPEILNQDPNLLKNLNTAVSTLAQEASKSSGASEQEYSNVGQYNVQEQPSKWNPTGAEILATLSNRQIENTNAVQWLDNRGFNRQQQIDLINKVFKGPNGVPPASQWSMEALRKYVMDNYRGSMGRYQGF